MGGISVLFFYYRCRSSGCGRSFHFVTYTFISCGRNQALLVHELRLFINGISPLERTQPYRFLTPDDGGKSSSRNVVFCFLEYVTMDKVQKRISTNCNAPSSVSFRIIQLCFSFTPSTGIIYRPLLLLFLSSTPWCIGGGGIPPRIFISLVRNNLATDSSFSGIFCWD